MAVSRIILALSVCLLVISTSYAKTLECRDHRVACSRWAMEGECLRNPGFMHIYCAVSCDRCRVQDNKCRDRELMCEAWAAVGECQINKPFMVRSCAKACSFCTPARDHTVPHVHADIVARLWKKYEQKNLII